MEHGRAKVFRDKNYQQGFIWFRKAQKLCWKQILEVSDLIPVLQSIVLNELIASLPKKKKKNKATSYWAYPMHVCDSKVQDKAIWRCECVYYYKTSVIISHNSKRCTEIACFIYSVYGYIWQRKAINPHIWVVGTSKCLLKKWND